MQGPVNLHQQIRLRLENVLALEGTRTVINEGYDGRCIDLLSSLRREECCSR